MFRNLVLSLILGSFSVATLADMPTTIGWVEPVQVMPEGFEIQAKIDTGADNSSLDVLEWNTFVRDDKEWVRLLIYNNNDRTLMLERVLERYARIKRKGAESLQRPVVNMWLCIGNQKFLAPVNLAKRKKFKYRMLIGRSFLKNGFLIDSSKKFTTSPACAR